MSSPHRSAAVDSRTSLIRPPSRSRPPSSSRSERSLISYGTMHSTGGQAPQEMVAVAAGGSASPLRTASPARQSRSDSPTSFAPSPFSIAHPLSPASSLSRRRKGKVPATDETDGIAAGGRYWRRFRLPRLAFELENKGSVARDHLANERTFLAWLRTSLGLASIGIAITQLFRLPSNSTSTTPSDNSTLTSAADAANVSAALAADAANVSAALAALTSSHPDLSPLLTYLQAQETRLVAAEKTVQDSTRYRHLGRPIGGTFLLLSLVFLLLGIHRYFLTQHALMKTPSQFPPSRRSVAFVSFCVGTLIVATFVAILTVR